MSEDLISRKSLIGTERLLMTDIVKNNEVARYILEQALYDIQHTPIAFYKEKVIEELKQISKALLMAENFNGAACIDKAIEIAEKRGIE